MKEYDINSQLTEVIRPLDDEALSEGEVLNRNDADFIQTTVGIGQDVHCYLIYSRRMAAVHFLSTNSKTTTPEASCDEEAAVSEPVSG